MNISIRSVVIASVLSLGMVAAHAQSRIGFVNSDRLMREAEPAKRAQTRIEKDFENRDQELQRMAKKLQTMQDDLERNGMTMKETNRRQKERTFSELNRDFQRRQREFREDLNQRRNEELASVLDRANAAIKKIAQDEKYDVILQEAVYANPSIDITDKVIKALGNK